MSHPSPWAGPWVSMQRSLSSCTLHPNSWPRLARQKIATWIEISQTSLRSLSEILIVIHKNLFSAYTRTSSPHRFRNWGVRMQYFAGWKLVLPSASITQWFSVTWQVQFSLGASRPWATLIHILDNNMFILIHWEIRCLWLKNPSHRWHWNIFDVDYKLYSTYLSRLECIDGHPKENHIKT